MAASPRRIAILINCLEVGGAQRMALRLMDMLHAEGHDVWLLTADATAEIELHSDPARAAELAARLVRLSRLGTRSPTLAKIATAPLQYCRLERFLRRRRIETLVSFEDRGNIFNLLTLGASRRVLAVRHPMISLGRLKSPLKRLLIGLFFGLFVRRATAINFNSVEAMTEFRDRYPGVAERLSVIPNFCDHELLHREAVAELPAEFRPLDGQPYVLACGRLKPVKGYAHLIRLFARVYSAMPAVKLVILGDGPLRDELAALATELRIAEAVVFAGFQANTAAWIARARIFALTSLSEGFPNVMLEALALGTAVVSVDCVSGPREILAPESPIDTKATAVDYAACGVLTPPLSGQPGPAAIPLDPPEKAFADALLRLLGDDRLREQYRQHGYQRSLEYSLASQREKWLALLSG